MSSLPPKIVGARRDMLGALVRRVAALNGISEGRMVGRNRSGNELHARKMLAQVAREFGFSFPEIGRAIDRDHTSVMALVREPMEISAAVMRDLRTVLDQAKIKAFSHPFSEGASVLTAELTSEQMLSLTIAAEWRGMTPAALLSAVMTVVIRDDLFKAVLDR